MTKGKLHFTCQLPPDIIEKIKQEKDKTGISQDRIILNALVGYFEINQSADRSMG